MNLILVFSVMEAFKCEFLKLRVFKVLALLFSLIAFNAALNVLIVLFIQVVLMSSVSSVMLILVESSLVK